MHATVCLLLLFPLVGPSIDELRPRLRVELEQPSKPLRQGEQFVLHVTFANDTPGPLEVGPFAIEGWGQVRFSRFFCRAPPNGSYHVKNLIATRVTPEVSESFDDIVDSDDRLAHADVVVTELYEDYLNDNASYHQHTLTLAPRSCQQVKFDLTKTETLWLFDAETHDLSPCTYEVQLHFDFTTDYSEGTHPSLVNKAWQGRMSTNVIRVRVAE